MENILCEDPSSEIMVSLLNKGYIAVVFEGFFKKFSEQLFIMRPVQLTAQKMKFSIKDFFSKCDQIRRKLRKRSMTF